MANSIQIAEQENRSSSISWVQQTLRNHINKNKVVLVVEGESDKTLFKRFFSQEKVVILPLGKCTEVVNVIQTLQKYKSKLLGIKDADFDRLNIVDYSFRNLFLTDAHDIEMMILCCPRVLEYINCKYSLAQKISEGIKDTIYKELLPLSMLKWYNSKYSCRITFDKTNIASCFVDGKFDYDKYKQKLFAINENAGKEPDIQIYNRWLTSHIALFIEVTNGHDAVKILYHTVCNIYRRNIKEKDFNNSIIEAYPEEAFNQTELGINIHYWAIRNFGMSLK